MHRKHLVRAIAWCAALAATAASAQPVLVAGTATPFKLARTPGGNFLLAQSGTGAHDGAVTLVSVWGQTFTLLSGLPSGTTPEGAAIGPTGVADAHTTIYVVIGEGDALGASPPPTQVPNPEGVSSALFSSVLRARFEPVPDGIREGFELSPADHQALADGHTVVKTNDSGERVEVDLLADFRDLAPDPVRSVRQSNPFAGIVAGGLTAADLAELGFEGPLPLADFLARLEPDSALGRRFEERRRLYVVDAGMNTVLEVHAVTGRWRVLARVPPLPNPLFPGVGGPVIEPVPTGVHLAASGDLLVTLLPGFPFPPGAGRVVAIDRESGAIGPHLGGLSMATDVLEIGGATYVLELSSDFFAGAPGRVVRFAAPGAAPEVVVGGLIGPAGMAWEPGRNELLVSESFTGRVIRVPLAP